jgi:hypothetical protein
MLQKLSLRKKFSRKKFKITVFLKVRRGLLFKREFVPYTYREISIARLTGALNKISC